MKRKLFTGMIAMSLGIVLSGVEPQKIVFDNLDNQFESTTAKGTFRKWTFNEWSKSFHGGGSMTVSDQGRTGKCVALKTGDKQRVCFYSEVSIPVVPGKDQLEISLFLRGKGSIMIMNYAYNEKNKYVGGWNSNKITVDTPEWKEYQFRIPITAAVKQAKTLRIAPMILSNSDLQLDDMQIVLIRN